MRDPLSTYRVQFHEGFDFDTAAEIAEYLRRLGVTHLYASPYLQAAPGSTHGYDVVDPSRVDAGLGGEEGHLRMCLALGRSDLGQVLDVVPNHMAIPGPQNRWWWDVLENGPSSVYASYFDVDWDPPQAKLRNTVLMPILGDHYGRVLEAGQIRLRRDGGGFVVRYFDHALPVAPRSLEGLLDGAARRCGSDELESIAVALGRLPPSTATDQESVRERHRDKEVLRARVARLCAEEPDVAAAIDAEVDAINGNVDAMGELLDRQNFRLAYWRTAGRELDWRRFFDISTLVALRVEDAQVFADTHALVLAWLASGVLDGLRIDHVDGLRDPGGYLSRLSAEAAGAWIGVEKVLEPGERLPEGWPVAGTTGYDFLNDVLGLSVDPMGETPLTDLYAEVTGEERAWEDVARDRKHEVMRESLAADVGRLTHLLVDVCEGQRRYRDYTRHELHETLRELIACFPVYRTYVEPFRGEVSEQDAAWVGQAVDAARARRPDLDPDLLTFLQDLLLLRRTGPLEAEWVGRFQQVTGPVMAKGVEDTAFYVYHRLAALNEVGGSPGRFGISLAEFHEARREAARRWPRGMTALSTHDTKRGEDTRARMVLLPEIPDRWAEVARGFLAATDGDVDRNTRYLLLQTWIGAWPLPRGRLLAYMEKAIREAKTHTSWVDPVSAYEGAVADLVERLYRDEALMAAPAALAASLVAPGRLNSLAWKLIQIAGPGVPDVYRGTELWDLSLVDPDNRRPVDWDVRRRLLADVPGLAPEQAMARSDEGLPKLLVVSRGLELRRHRPEAFGPDAEYAELESRGARADHAVAFRRGDAVVAVAPRLPLRLGGDWGDTRVVLPPGRWRNVLTGDDRPGGEVRLAELLWRFPVALLERG